MPGQSTSPRWFSRIKDVLLFGGGFAGMVWEAVFTTEPRAILVGAYLLALGLPVFNGFDRLFQRSTESAPPADEPVEPPPAA